MNPQKITLHFRMLAHEPVTWIPSVEVSINSMCPNFAFGRALALYAIICLFAGSLRRKPYKARICKTSANRAPTQCRKTSKRNAQGYVSNMRPFLSGNIAKFSEVRRGTFFNKMPELFSRLFSKYRAGPIARRFSINSSIRFLPGFIKKT